MSDGKWRYSVQRGNNWASRPVYFDDILDACAFVCGQERFMGHYSIEFIIRKTWIEDKAKKEDTPETEMDEKEAPAP